MCRTCAVPSRAPDSCCKPRFAARRSAVPCRAGVLDARRAGARVRLGDAPGLLQVDAQRATASATLQQVQSDLAVSQNEVALFRALGGGWRTDAGTR
jgi:outer membrane protein TolC